MQSKYILRTFDFDELESFKPHYDNLLKSNYVGGEEGFEIETPISRHRSKILARISQGVLITYDAKKKIVKFGKYMGDPLKKDQVAILSSAIKKIFDYKQKPIGLIVSPATIDNEIHLFITLNIPGGGSGGDGIKIKIP